MQGISNQICRSEKQECIDQGCLKPISKTHAARNCNQRRACKVCNEKHPTSLHGFKLKKKIYQGTVSDLYDQSGTSQDGVLRSNVTICDENNACGSTKISAQKSTDNVEEFGSAAAKTLERKVCVDDMLKSVESKKLQ